MSYAEKFVEIRKKAARPGYCAGREDTEMLILLIERLAGVIRGDGPLPDLTICDFAAEIKP